MVCIKGSEIVDGHPILCELLYVDMKWEFLSELNESK